MTTQEKQLNIIKRLENSWKDIKKLQENYKNNFNKYFQGLGSHSEIPDGENFQSVDMTVKPGDQIHNYADFWRGVYLKVEKSTDETGQEIENKIEDHLFPEDVLSPVSNLTTRVRFDVSESLEGHYWKMTLEYKDETGHWTYSKDLNDKIDDWEKIEKIEF